MSKGLFVVRATITRDKDAAFNAWYDTEHVPQLLRYKGALSAHRYRKLIGDDQYQYMAVYEFISEAVLLAFLQSQELQDLRAEYNKRFGAVSESVAQAWVQISP
jgi:hypothetical protein